MRWFRTSIAFLGALAYLVSAPAAMAQPSGTEGTPKFYNSVQDTGQFLTDSDELARVDDKSIRVFDFRDGYYSIFAQFRPAPDSLGRAEFLENMVRKEVLAFKARELARPLSFGDRADLRAYQQRLLSNLLYTRAVSDSVDLRDATVLRVYEHYGRELKLRHLFFTDRQTAERVRGELMRGVLPWSTAMMLYASRNADGKREAETAWYKFENLPPDLGLAVWPLKVGEYAPVLVTAAGYHLAQVTAQRPRPDLPTLNALRTPIRNVLRFVQTARLREQVQSEALEGMDVVIDSSAVARLATRFSQNVTTSNSGFGASLEFDVRIPELPDSDLSQVLATWKGGSRITLREVLHSYQELPPIGRPSIHTPEGLSSFLLSVLLEPRLIEIAFKRGLDRDSMYVALMARKEEEIRVMHLVQDSVFSRVTVTNADRRAFYEQNKAQFITFSRARFVKMLAANLAEVDSLRGLLRTAPDLDSLVARHRRLRGEEWAGMNELAENAHGPDWKLVFEVLRPGENTFTGPDKLGRYLIHHLIARDPGRQMPFEEAESIIDENLQNARQEAALQAFVERLKSRHTIEWHPELVMRIRLTDPVADSL